MPASMDESAFRQVLSWPVVRSGLTVAIVVGSILNLINQGEAIWGGASLDWWKLCLTYCVPYLVASWGAYSAFRRRL